MKNLIDRQAAIDTILSLANCSTVRELYEYIQEHQLTNFWTGGINDAIDAVIGVPSAQPDCDEWCTDCKEYDQEKHCCPRWNRVIRQTAEELKKERPEIIRCKDCKHYTLKPQVNSNYCHIRHCTRSALISSKPDDYCSWAERRTDE